MHKGVGTLACSYILHYPMAKVFLDPVRMTNVLLLGDRGEIGRGDAQ
jgi:hypothetical protein